MKQIQYLLILLGSILLLSACKDDDDNGIRPSTITDVKTFALPGEIRITWTRVEPITFEYLKISYYDELTEKNVIRLASRYADAIVIPNTRKKFGTYEFSIQPYSVTDTGGDIIAVSGTSGAAPKTISVADVVDLTLDGGKLYTDAQEPSEGPIADLVDGNNNTYFHAAWSVNKGPMPHYIVADLGKMVKGFRFKYVTRNHGSSGNHPKKLNVYVSKTFDGSTYDVTDLKLVAELDDLPNGASQNYSSEDYIIDEGYQYIWFQIKETHAGTKYFALAELGISELELKIIDPEASDGNK